MGGTPMLLLPSVHGEGWWAERYPPSLSFMLLLLQLLLLLLLLLLLFSSPDLCAGMFKFVRCARQRVQLREQVCGTTRLTTGSCLSAPPLSTHFFTPLSPGLMSIQLVHGPELQEAFSMHLGALCILEISPPAYTHPKAQFPVNCG